MWERIEDRIRGKAPPGLRRDPRWRNLRNDFLESQPRCQVCGTHHKLRVHHIIPFHIAPDLELEWDNLMTLCEGGRFRRLSCHQVFGHLGNFQRYNPVVRSDVMAWGQKLGGHD